MTTNRRTITAATIGALALAGTFAGTAHATDDLEGWHTWATTNESEPTSSTVDWPQTYVGKGQLAPDCGVWYQQDRYEEAKHGASIADVIADGVLTNGEDHHIVQDWRFVYGGDCVEPDPTPTPEPTVTPDPEPSTDPEPDGPACGPEGSCGEVPTEAEPERHHDASSTWTEAPAPAEAAVPVVAEATFTG